MYACTPAARSSSDVNVPVTAARAVDGIGRLREAERLIGAGRAADAEPLVRPLLHQDAYRGAAEGLLAIIALAVGQTDRALAHARSAMAAEPRVARHPFVLGRALKVAGDRDGAAAAYDIALAIDTNYAEAMVSLGIVKKDGGDLEAAVALYDRALRLRPSLAAAHANRAHALALQAERRLKDGVDARPGADVLDAQGRAVSLDVRNPQLHRNYGVLLRQAGRLREAMAAFNAALTLDARDLESCLGLGATLGDLGGVALESECYAKWLAANPPSAPVMLALAGSLTLLGDADTALTWAERALAIDADAIGLMQCASVLQQLRRVEEAQAHSRRALDEAGRMPEMYAPHLLGLNYVCEEPAVLAAEHEEFGAQLPLPFTRPPHRTRTAGDPLRIGYVSGDFVRHSVAYFIEPLLEHHDTERFEVVCYHNNPRSDHFTARLQAHGHRWVECAGISDDALARQIRADGIDVLVDLSGPTARSRLLMFAQSPAPLQLGYLGYPTRSGVPAIDFRITDGVIDPEGEAEPATERPLRLGPTMFAFRPDAAPELAAPPMLRNGHVTFGSFNNTAKITDRTLAMWAAAMVAVPGSRLLLKAASMGQASVRAGIERVMAAHGVGAERLDLQPRRDGDLDHLALYNEIDIALDTYPYNGATTTCEALWMGLPVVSRRGRTHASRMGASLLGAIGCGGWVADDDAAFASIAERLAGDAAALAQWRADARERLAATPLLDHAGFARGFEAAVESAWRTAVVGRSEDPSA